MRKIAVIGAGVMGLATARALAGRGHDVVVYEQFEPGHTRGSSHGRSRIFRLAYAEEEYVRLAQESLGLWRELEADSGETLLELNGLLEIVGSLEESTARTLEACGVEWYRLSGEEAERRYPVRVPEGSFAVLQPEAGIVRADKALAAFARDLDVRYGTRVHPDELDAEVVVVTAGSWVNELLKEPLPVKVTRETVCYFRPENGRPIASLVSFKPDSHTHDMYSLADPVYGLKVGAHHAGPEVDPNGTGEPEPRLIEQIASWARETYRLAEPEPVAAETCLYTTTADETFILERRGRLVIGSPCSGHGFKFAPAIGKRLAELATGV
ncbi:MAG: FAD-dependent oxidoreductase [Actinobacteria bacterium]|nr:MAG: FAD-dependent oxidoreductase [Actinomycetota bacterium]